MRNPYGYQSWGRIRQNAFSDQQKLQTLKEYAPLVYLEKKETFFPSSVEWSFPYFKRIIDKDGRYSLISKQPLSCPEQVLPYFHGEYKNLSNVPIYAYWVDKENDTVDLNYFLWYPYNRGKYIDVAALGQPLGWCCYFGNHVGDWEGVQVRMQWTTDSQGNRVLVPIGAHYSQHGGGDTREWNKIKRYNNTHPIVYSAAGSHANYHEPGQHVYKDFVVVKLADIASQGPEWRTWNNLKAYDYNQKKGLNTEWPVWMSTCYDYTIPGRDPSDPSSGAIYRWGDEKDEKSCIPGIECLLSDAPDGPPAKTWWWEGAIGGTTYCPK